MKFVELFVTGVCVPCFILTGAVLATLGIATLATLVAKTLHIGF